MVEQELWTLFSVSLDFVALEALESPVFAAAVDLLVAVGKIICAKDPYASRTMLEDFGLAKVFGICRQHADASNDPTVLARERALARVLLAFSFSNTTEREKLVQSFEGQGVRGADLCRWLTSFLHFEDRKMR